MRNYPLGTKYTIWLTDASPNFYLCTIQSCTQKPLVTLKLLKLNKERKKTNGSQKKLISSTEKINLLIKTLE